jgi:tetratricopeptide (TPR) repeat protein
LSSNSLASAVALLVVATLVRPALLHATSPQDVEGASSADAGLSDLSGSFDQLWRRYQQAESSGQAELRQRILNEMRRLRVERNAFHLHDIALAFSFQGSTYLEQGNLAAARASFETAAELDPALPTPLFGLARVARRSGGFWPWSYVGYVINGYLASFHSIWNGYYARADILLVATLSVFVALGLFALAMLYRYAMLINHDFAELFTAKLGPFGVRGLTLLVLFLPLILTVGFAWLVPYWLALTFTHQTRSEKALSAASLVFFLILGPALEFHAQWSRTLVNPMFRASMSSAAGTFDATDVFVLQTALERHPDDRDLKLILATQYKNLGEYQLSASLYREILSDTPTDLAAQVNLGNIYFAERDWEGATGLRFLLLQQESCTRGEFSVQRPGKGPHASGEPGPSSGDRLRAQDGRPTSGRRRAAGARLHPRQVLWLGGRSSPQSSVCREEYGSLERAGRGFRVGGLANRCADTASRGGLSRPS